MEIEMIALIAIVFILFIMIWPRLFNYAEYWPTPIKKARKMLKFAGLKKGEVFYDLGCGDGRFVVLADREFKADAIGIEIDPFRFLIAKLATIMIGSSSTIKFGNYLNYSLNDADVIALFLKPKPMKELESEIRNLKKGTRIVSYMWKFPDLKPSKVDEREQIYLYTIR